MRTTHVLVVLIVTSCLASSDRDFAELSDVLSAEDVTGLEKGPHPASYSKIPFFALKYKAKRASQAKVASDCQLVCSQRKACKSFSFSVKKKDCLWSKEALAFNGLFTFFTKRTSKGKKGSGDNRMSRYRAFPGLMYEEKAWTRYEKQEEGGCRKLCDKAKDNLGRTCHGFSYNEHTQTCLLSPFGIHYDVSYDYFERNPQPKIVKKKVEKISKKKGKVKVVVKKKKIVKPLDVKLKKKKKNKVVMIKKYKAALVQQEVAAKKGAKQLAKQQRKAKKKKKKIQKTGVGIKKLARKKKEEKKKLKKKAKAKKKKKALNRKEALKAHREKTKKKYLILRKRQKESARKQKHEASKKLRIQKAKMQEKLKKELSFKTKKKEIAVKRIKHQEKRRKQIDGIIKSGKKLAATERKNKKVGYGAAEHEAKEKLVKMQVKGVKARRHARHKRAYAKYVARTLKNELKKRKTSAAVSIAMKQMMKQRKAGVAASLKKQKKANALVHLVSLNIAKLKAKASGIQHSINISAKKGKKAPAQEVKLRFTMNTLRQEQRKEQFKKQKLAKMGRELTAKKAAVKRLDNRMTAKKVGRRRRATKTAHKKKNKKKKLKKKMKKAAPPKAPKKSNVGARRRRTKARLTTRFMKDAEQNQGLGKAYLPGLPPPQKLLKKKPTK